MHFSYFRLFILKKYPNKTQELLQYMSIIREAANRSSLSWRTYDEQFRLRQATNVQPWGRLNSDLWLRVMTTNNYQSQTESYVNRAACLDFNNGYCSFIHCKFTHACSNCGGTNHGRQTCFKLTSPNVNRGGTWLPSLCPWSKTFPEAWQPAVVIALLRSNPLSQTKITLILPCFHLPKPLSISRTYDWSL